MYGSLGLSCTPRRWEATDQVRDRHRCTPEHPCCLQGVDMATVATMGEKEQAYSDSFHSSKALSVALSREQEVQLAELRAAVEPAMQVLRFAL